MFHVKHRERYKMSEQTKLKFFSTKRLDSTKAQYRMAFGERSNGKTFAVLEKILENYALHGDEGVYIRRWDIDIKGKRADKVFASVVLESKVWKKYFSGIYSGITFRNGAWYLYADDETLNKKVVNPKPVCYALALSNVEHDKSTAYPLVTTIFFDEFLSRRAYIPDEFVLFMNTLSTIIRHRKNVVIYMMGNTVNNSSPYFTEMGLTNVKSMKKNTMDIYKYGESGLLVALEYADSISSSGKESDVYFAFNNPKLAMITDGAWEMALYPHLPMKYRPCDVKLTYFIIYESEILQCEIIKRGKVEFTYIHRKSGEIKNPEHDLVFSPEVSPYPNWSRRIIKARNELENIIVKHFTQEKVFYQDNEVGEIVRNYIMWCKSAPLI